MSSCEEEDDMMSDSTAGKYDLFLSHLQRNGQDAVISMQMCLQQLLPNIKIFIDLDVNMHGDLKGTLRNGVENCSAFVFFITDGILTSQWCLQEFRWAMQFHKTIVLVRETDDRHGAIAMTDFLKQVPKDLLEPFQNIIAIPWYRQPAFRQISVQEIVQAAGIGNKYARDLQNLQKVKEDLEEIYMGSDDPVSAVDVIQQESWAMRAVFFLGGFTQFNNRCVNALYTIVFNVSFWTCGILCAANLAYQAVPYHIVSTDALTAYVHFPAWQSWLTWRYFVKSKKCDELLTKVYSQPHNQYIVAITCRVAGWLVLLVQIVMVSDVLFGFSLPYALGQGLEQGCKLPFLKEFKAIHSYGMWFIIPPVIAAMFGSYSMFAFIAMLHILDIRTVRSVLLECLNEGLVGSTQTQKPSPQKGMTHAVSASGRSVQAKSTSGRSETSQFTRQTSPFSSMWSPRSETMSRLTADTDDLEMNLRRVAVEDKVLEAAAELLMTLLENVQRRIDSSCAALGCLWLHLVFFSFCQVMAITVAFRAHATGDIEVEYRWWWALQDFFHLGGGCVLLVVAMGVFCLVTAYLQKMRIETLFVFMRAVPPPKQHASALTVLAMRPLGMHVLGQSLFIDVPKAVGFFCLMFALVILNTMGALNGVKMV